MQQLNEFLKLIDSFIGSSPWFPFLLPDGSASKREPSKPASRFNSGAEDEDTSLPVEFANSSIQRYFEKIKFLTKLFIIKNFIFEL